MGNPSTNLIEFILFVVAVTLLVAKLSSKSGVLGKHVSLHVPGGRISFLCIWSSRLLLLVQQTNVDYLDSPLQFYERVLRANVVNNLMFTLHDFPVIIMIMCTILNSSCYICFHYIFFHAIKHIIESFYRESRTVILKKIGS